jgi:hypothetical protein
MIPSSILMRTYSFYLFKQINMLQTLDTILVTDLTWKCKSVMPSQKAEAWKNKVQEV